MTDRELLELAARAAGLEGEWEHLKPYGYAPGGYMGTCFDCSERSFDLDKRAVRCRPCAEKRHHDARAAAEIGKGMQP